MGQLFDRPVTGGIAFHQGHRTGNSRFDCLYAFNKPVFVVDAYTGRILGRHRLLEPGRGMKMSACF